jgi:glucose/mannose-6-phosphate isomerase
MLLTLEKAAEHLAPPSDADSTCDFNLEAPENLVFGGVGGSGIVGEVLSDYCRTAIGIPSFVCRTPRIPNFVGKRTLCIAISYSGTTNETLGMYDQARSAGAQLASVCSGGRLLALSRTDKIPYVRVPENLLPRVALPEMLAATVFVIGKAGVVKDSRRLLRTAAEAVATQIGTMKLSIPLTENKAKQAAMALNNRLPLLIGGEENASVLRRFKNELNENSKVPAFYFALPEAYHDDIEGLSTLSQLCKTQPFLLHGQNESEGDMKTASGLEKLLVELGFATPISFEGKGDDRLGWLLSAIIFGDYASTYLAILRDVDPSSLNLIPKFRAIRGQV